MKSFIKNLSKIVFTNFLIVIFFIILIELFFGYWFEKYNFGPYMREHRMKNQPTTFKYEGKEIKSPFVGTNSEPSVSIVIVCPCILPM